MSICKAPLHYLLVASCVFSSACSNDSGQTMESMRDHVSALTLSLDPKFPGRGTTDYPGNTVEDVPKAYAMVLLGDLTRQQKTDPGRISELGRRAGEWLLDHSDENKNGVTGWGVPVAWDPYGDGSINPIHSEYTISTAIAIHALMDWMAAAPLAPRDRIVRTIHQAIEPYLSGAMRSPSGIFPYSLEAADRIYDTFNPAAYFAGQVQRFSRVVNDPTLAERLQKLADQNMQVLLEQHSISPETGAWYWNYSIQENVPNDLPHAAYIIDGIRTYIAYGGNLSEKFDRKKIISHLNEFPDKTAGSIRAWPRFRKSVTLPARSYDIGMALYLLCTESDLESLRPRYFVSIPKYLDKDGAFLKYPAKSDEPKLVIKEYETYLWRGMTTCIANARG